LRLARGADSVWPGYVAAVASLLLALLLLAGVLVVAISQIGRVVGNYNRQLITEVIQDERRASEIEDLDRKAQVLTQAKNQAQAVQLPVFVPAPVVAQPSDRGQEQTLDAQLKQRAADLAMAQAEAARLELMVRQSSFSGSSPGTNKIVRIAFGAGSQGLEEQVARQLRASLSAEELSQRRWLIEAGAKGLNLVAHREVFRLMLSLRAQLQDMGLPPERVRLVLNTERLPHDFTGPVQPGDVIVVLRPDTQERGAS
jgi:hypothetical protein